MIFFTREDNFTKLKPIITSKFNYLMIFFTREDNFTKLKPLIT